MTTPLQTAAPLSLSRRLFNRQTVIAFVAGAAIAGGVGAAAKTASYRPSARCQLRLDV